MLYAIVNIVINVFVGQKKALFLEVALYALYYKIAYLYANFAYKSIGIKEPKNYWVTVSWGLSLLKNGAVVEALLLQH